MDNSSISNKMINMDDKETKIKFNIAMHGFKKDQVVRYTSESRENQLFIRRRLKDNDGFVEVVQELPKSAPKKESTREVKKTSHTSSQSSDKNSNKFN